MSVSSLTVARSTPEAVGCLDDKRTRLVAVAQRILGDRERAEEVYQDVRLAHWARPDAYDPARGPLVAYLTVLCRSRAYDVARSDSARQRREERARALAPDHPWLDPAEHIADDRVARAVADLPPLEAQVIELAFFQGLSYVGVAQRLGLPEGTVKTRIRRGLRHLEVALGGVRPQAGP